MKRQCRRRQRRASRTTRERHFTRTCLHRRAFPIAADGTGVDTLVKALVVAGDRAQVEKRLRELLKSGLDELLLMLVPVADEVCEREQLMQVIAAL